MVSPRHPCPRPQSVWRASVCPSPPQPLRVRDRREQAGSAAPAHGALRVGGLVLRQRAGAGAHLPFPVPEQDSAELSILMPFPPCGGLPRGGGSCPPQPVPVLVGSTPPVSQLKRAPSPTALPSWPGPSVAHQVSRDQGWLRPEHRGLLEPQKHSSRTLTWDCSSPVICPACDRFTTGPQK